MLPIIEPGLGPLPRVGPWRAEARVDPRREADEFAARETGRFIATLRSSESFMRRLDLDHAGPRAAETLLEYLAGVRVAVHDAHAAGETRRLGVHEDVPTLPWGSMRRYSRGGNRRARASEQRCPRALKALQSSAETSARSAATGYSSWENTPTTAASSET
jgi:hypothetical protein